MDFPPIYTPLANQFSFACRFNLSRLLGHEYFLLIETGATDFGLTIWLREDAGQRGIAVTCSGVNGSVLRYSTSHGFSTNHWYGLVVTWDGSASASGIHIYLDGSELSYASSADGVAPLRAQDGDWIIAGRVTDNLRNFSGRLADLGAWNTVLSSDDRAAFFNGLVPHQIANPNLVFDARLVNSDTTDSVSLLNGSIVG
ncbi:LamG-like jellyroll fold domain-containing protein, partial [Hydrocoleum sp. CS-953]|uniref:LamG-like jellyroll fold domain-containing protein n=1 Tax=Hydrocoleum sp. CS-953 TaxID=1671698 RepID=UPI00352A4FA7